MKKNIIIAAIAAASALLLCASCRKQELLELKNEGKTFTAAINQELTKTTITSDFKVNWVDGDKININGAVYSATKDGSDATKASFTKESGSDPSSPYKAIYPASLYVTDHFELPATQTYESGKFNAPMYAESSIESLSFKNICGVICFALKGTATVKSISITANEAICGTFTMADATIVNLTGSGKTVILDCGEGAQLNESTATNFYVYLPPKSSYTAGMKFVITDTDGGTFTKTTTKAVTIARNNIYTFEWTPTFAPDLPDGALPGVFSVASDKQVYFSQGNLQATYNGSSYTWGFAANQYDFVGNAAGNITIDSQTSGKTVDLFGWSTNATNNNWGIHTKSDKKTGWTDGDFKDWGIAYCTSNGITNTTTWRTLTTAEWQYLFSYDGSGSGGTDYSNDTRAGLYAYGVTVVGKANCVVLYPDGFTGTKVNNNDTTSYDEESEWAAAQSAGVVCLPAAGNRNGSNVNNVGSYGYYWSSSAKDANYAFNVYFGSVNVHPAYNVRRALGSSVRLVTDAN